MHLYLIEATTQMNSIDYKILDMLGEHQAYEDIVDACLVCGKIVNFTYINKLHRKHFPT